MNDSVIDHLDHLTGESARFLAVARRAAPDAAVGRLETVIAQGVR